MTTKVILLHLLPLLIPCESARILGIVPTPSYSHQTTFQPLWKELSLRGHQVTLLTTNIMNDSSLVNLTEIDLSFSYASITEYRQDVIYSNSFASVYVTYWLLVKLCDEQFEHPDVKALIENTSQHFDLVILEAGRWPYATFAERFQCPLITVTSLPLPNSLSSQLGNPVHPTVYPDYTVAEAASLWSRVYAVLFDAAMYVFWQTSYMWLSQDIADKRFGSNYSRISDIIENISLNMINADHAFFDTKPLLSNMIEVSLGPHRISNQVLSKELQELLDNANDGFIYFSLGSNVRSEELPTNMLKDMMETFKELPYLVLWKQDGSLKDKPENVVTLKWMPQRAILKHPNLKLFITQGGLQSLEEARNNSVPIVGIPFFADQQYNIINLVSRGMGLSIDRHNFNKNDFKETILEVIQNPRYRRNAEKLNALVNDQPLSGLEKTIWWIEFVIRHNGAEHLRSSILKVPFYQYYLLDVYLVLSTMAVITIGLIVVFVKLLIKICYNSVFEKLWKIKKD